MFSIDSLDDFDLKKLHLDALQLPALMVCTLMNNKSISRHPFPHSGKRFR